MAKQTMRQAARLAASQAFATRRRERAQRDRRLEKLAIEVPRLFNGAPEQLVIVKRPGFAI
jgi:hypothetical protein